MAMQGFPLAMPSSGGLSAAPLVEHSAPPSPVDLETGPRNEIVWSNMRLTMGRAGDQISSATPPSYGVVISRSPLVTISKRAVPFNQALGFAALADDLDRYGPSIHFVGLCNTIEPNNSVFNLDTADALASDYARVTRDYRNAHFVILCNTELEVFELSRRGVQSILANELIFTDEAIFDVAPGAPRYDAVYNAVPMPFKRHHLAAAVRSLLLIMRPYKSEFTDAALAGLGHADVANRRSGDWRLLATGEVSRLLGEARVGLCLSEVEGPMRASMEYLLCGLPVVSTPNLGGRNRYFRSDYALICEPSPESVAAAVQDLATRDLPREKIRMAALEMIRFDRRNFLGAFNVLTARYAPGAQRVTTIRPFIDAAIRLGQGARLPPLAG